MRFHHLNDGNELRPQDGRFPRCRA